MSNERSFGIGKILIILWIIFSIAYVVNDVRIRSINQAYGVGQKQGVQYGQNNTILYIMDQSKDCNAVKLYAGEEGEEGYKEVNLVDIACVEGGVRSPQASEVAPEASAVPETPAPEAPAVE